MLNIQSEQLIDFATNLLSSGGVQADEAALIAKSLVSANLRGHDSHGVMRIPQYLELLKDGKVNTNVSLDIEKETPCLIYADANWGFGQTHAQTLVNKLIAKAKATGIGVGTIVHCSHIGRLGEYCEMAAAEGLVSMVMVNTHGNACRIAPPGGKRPRLGTNPLAMGVPTDGHPLLLDIGTSATAEGKVRVKKFAGEQTPEGWILDKDGNPSTDPNVIYNDPPGTILPMGGTQGYKGFGLGMMVEVFSGALSGGYCIREVPKNQNGNCVFMQVINPEFFAGTEHFAKEVKDLDAWVRSCPTIDGVEKIMLPGDPEHFTNEKRSAEGIPFDEGNWGKLTDLATSLGVEAPQV